LAIAGAIVARQSPQQADWNKVARSADQAIPNWGGVTDVARQSRLPVVRYTSALSASRLKDASAVQRNQQAIGTFALFLKQVFQDNGTKNANRDPGILENIVAPALMVPLANPGDAAQDLAALTAAKGRL